KGTVQALDIITERVIRGEPDTAIVQPCGYGKSDLLRLAAFQLWDQNVVACTLALSPNEYLRDQLVAAPKISDWYSRYRISPGRGRQLNFTSVTGPCVDYAANGEFLLSSTIQLVLKNLDNPGGFRDWIDAVMRRTGKRVLVVVDETHTNTSRNDWG